MSEPVTIKLRKPLQLISGEMVDVLTIRPICAKDLRKLAIVEGMELDAILALASRLTGRLDREIDLLEGEDLEEVISVVSGFMPRYRVTGNER
jgi:hypothetical protein